MEQFTNISRTDSHEEEYIEPILRILYSDEIKYIDSTESSDLMLVQNKLPQQNKPYILRCTFYRGRRLGRQQGDRKYSARH